ncbi:MAG: FAD-binding oxidoreductase [Candidatus Saccharibacteria bacterium]
MSKIAHYLQEHLIGEVMTSVDARRYFATDASIFVLPPALVVYPRNENDIRKTARFTWQLAERGRVIPISARGSGSDQSGAALGNGIMLVFPAHLNRILELDSKAGTVTVEPGINYGKLQQTLHTHGRFLPPFPASLEYSTIGGAVANNAGGEKSVKYGTTRDFVQSLRVVLANGEVIETNRISKRELSKKLGLASFEGEIYRSVDTLLEENRELLDKLPLNVAQNNAGYNLLDIKHHDGSFDLTPLFVGSQGTLGIISEVALKTEAYNPLTTLFMATFETVRAAQDAIHDLLALPESPSSLELVDGNLLNAVHAVNPNLLKEVMLPPFPAIVLLVEFDSAKEHTQKRLVKRTQKIFENYALSMQTETELERQQQLWKIRQATGVVLGNTDGQLRAVPIIDDAAIPVDRYQEYLEGVYKLFEKTGLQPAVWGHAGGGSFTVQPLLNIGQVGDRQKAFRLMDEYYKFVISLGGTPSGERNDGRLRAPYLEQLYGSEIYALFQKVKQIFDPYNTLNPGVKIGSSIDDIKALVRPDYNLAHFYDHLPRS